MVARDIVVVPIVVSVDGIVQSPVATNDTFPVIPKMHYCAVQIAVAYYILVVNDLAVTTSTTTMTMMMLLMMSMSCYFWRKKMIPNPNVEIR